MPDEIPEPPVAAAPYIKTNVKKSSGRFLKYGVWWSPHVQPPSMELDCIRMGGRWKKQDGGDAGEGLYFHFRRFQELVWPERIWEKGPFKNYWADACLNAYIEGTYVGVMGCSGAGKSDSFGVIGLTDWYSQPWCTTVLVSSTDLASLDRRIWGMITQYHRAAKRNCDWLPGYLIEGRRIIIQDPQNEHSEGRDFKNGLIGVPCRRGGQFVGLSALVGIHNKRIILLADESNLMPRGFLDATANLQQNPFFKCVALGNPNETTNAHGTICEPSVEIGGWEGAIDQTPGTKTWKTRFPNGICLQLPASDSPNLRAPADQPPPFDFLPTAKAIADSVQIWGKDDWHHQMFIEAKMPRGQGSRRVLTRQACNKFGAFKEPNWRDSRRTKITFLDAAYRGVGGDRCIFGELQFGYEVEAPDAGKLLNSIISQKFDDNKGRQIIALIDLVAIPISSEQGAESAEDQIVKFVTQACKSRDVGPENFYYDAGMRTSLVQAFARADWQQSNSIDCGGKPTEAPVSSEIRTSCRDYYSKFVTELWFSVRMAVEASQFRGMIDEAATEFCQREWMTVSGNRIEIESKADYKLKSGRSPDMADAVAVGLFGARQKGFVITKLSSLIPHDRRGPHWMDDLKKKARKLVASGQLNFKA